MCILSNNPQFLQCKLKESKYGSGAYYIQAITHLATDIEHFLIQSEKKGSCFHASFSLYGEPENNISII